MQWYYQNSNGETIGPVSSIELRQLAARDQISPSTLVRKGETGRWFVASTIQGLIFSTTPKAKPGPDLPVPPPVPEHFARRVPAPTKSNHLDDISVDSTKRRISRPRQLQHHGSFFWSLIDPRFTRFVTLYIYSILYVLFLIGFVVFNIINAIQAIHGILKNESNLGWVLFLDHIYLAFGSCIALLIFRVSLECVAVIFRISETLLDIRYDIDDLKIPRR